MFRNINYQNSNSKTQRHDFDELEILDEKPEMRLKMSRWKATLNDFLIN